MITPTSTVDLSASVGAAPNDLMLRIYDEAAFRRFTVAWGGIEPEGLRVPWAALPAFGAGLAGVGQTQVLLSEPVDLTTTPSGVVLAPAMPGFFFFPVAVDPLRVVNISSAGTLVTAPTFRAGNDVGHGNWGTGPVDAEAFVASTARATRPALATGSMVTMADLAAPIVLDVLTPGAGSGFAWSVRFAIVGSLVAAF